MNTSFELRKLVVTSVCTVMQGNKSEELPEEILCGVRLNGINYKNYRMLGLYQDPPSP